MATPTLMSPHVVEMHRRDEREGYIDRARVESMFHTSGRACNVDVFVVLLVTLTCFSGRFCNEGSNFVFGVTLCIHSLHTRPFR